MSVAAWRAVTQLAAAAALVSGVGCNDRDPGAAEHPGARHLATAGRPSGPAASAWVTACEAAVAQATGAPPRERTASVLAGCRPCGVSWDPLIGAERGTATAADILAVIDACGGTCTGTASTGFSDAIAEVARGDAPALPWRQLARACPATLQVDDATARFASATWYALARIASGITDAARGSGASHLAAAAAGLMLPLPARSVAGTGFVLEPIDRVDPRLARIHVSITSNGVTVGALPLAQVVAGTLALVAVPGPAYPGRAVALDELGPGIDALAHELAPAVGELDGPLVIAPRGLAASRVLEVMRSLGERRAYLGALGPRPAGGWIDIPAAAAPAFAGKVPGRVVAVRIGGGGAVAVVGGWGGIRTAYQLLAGDGTEASRIAAAVTRIAGSEPAVAIDAVAPATGADLAHLLDVLAAAGVETVVAAPSLRWPTKTRTFDEAALRAERGAPGAP